MNIVQKLDTTKLYAVSIGVMIIVVGVVIYLFVGSPFPQPAKQNITPTIVSKGRGDIPACTTCHGDKGQGNPETGVPRLAGLNAHYIEKQLQDFANRMDKLPGVLQEPFTPPRVDSIMSQLASQLSKADRQEIGHYYANLSFSFKGKIFESSRIQKGESLVRIGKPAQGMPACVSCHGHHLLGFAENFPPLLGQPPQYIVKQLNDWRAGLRSNDHLALMANISKQMSQEEILSIAAYLTTLSVNFGGKE